MWRWNSNQWLTLIPVFPHEIRYPSPANTSGTPARRPGGTPSQYNPSPNRYLYRWWVGFFGFFEGFVDQIWDVHPKSFQNCLVPKNANQFFSWMEMVISNHFLYKDLVHHPIDSQPFINRWDPIRFQVAFEFEWCERKRMMKELTGNLNEQIPSDNRNGGASDLELFVEFHWFWRLQLESLIRVLWCLGKVPVGQNYPSWN